MADAKQQALELIYAGRTARREGYCEIPTTLFIDRIDVGMPPLPPLAFYQFRSGKAERIREADQPYSPLALSLHPSVWVREEEFEIVRNFAERVLSGRPVGGGKDMPASVVQIPLEKRVESMRKSALLVVEDLFETPSAENMKKSVKMVGSFVYVIMKEPQAYQLLSKLSSHDPYTLQHSVGTAVHSIILARKLGIHDDQELTEAGMAGLLHDIGKTKVKKEIINKTGPLDPEEWEEMRGHAEEGFTIVKDHRDISDRVKRAILEHHEDRNGTGYPDGKHVGDLDVLSRIVCLCDMFNALTTDRTYSKARTPFDAFHFMREKLAHKYDEELFKQLVLVYGGKI